MTPLDLLVIGGGVTGLGIARLAAHNGWSVALIDRSDLASGASSASSHMLHGGLRYLEHGQFALVREALAERAALLRMAPALARPTRFLVPLTRGGRWPGWKLRAGLSLYDLLAGRDNLSPHSMVRAAEALALEPGLAHDGLTGAGLYGDVVMDDARLAIAVARDAVAHGAAIHPWTEWTGARPAERGSVDVTARDRLSGEERRFVARVLVNATGAWADETRRELVRALHPGAPDPERLLRPTRGTHLVYPRLTHGHGLLVTAAGDRRVCFVVPFAGRSLVGTTEIEADPSGDPDASSPTSDEIRYLAETAARAIPSARDMRPLAVFAGLRPLLDPHGGRLGTASREHRVVQDGAVFTVVGGKYTTFRAMARDALDRAAASAGHGGRPIVDPVQPLPVPPVDDATPAELGAHAAGDGLARRLADALRRRSTRWLDPDRGLGIAVEVAGAMGRRLGWSPEREREEIDCYESSVSDEQSRIERALTRPPRRTGAPGTAFADAAS